VNAATNQHAHTVDREYQQQQTKFTARILTHTHIYHTHTHTHSHTLGAHHTLPGDTLTEEEGAQREVLHEGAHSHQMTDVDTAQMQTLGEVMCVSMGRERGRGRGRGGWRRPREGGGGRGRRSGTRETLVPLEFEVGGEGGDEVRVEEDGGTAYGAVVFSEGGEGGGRGRTEEGEVGVGVGREGIGERAHQLGAQQLVEGAAGLLALCLWTQ
jgi:hypothetical protein